MQLYWQAKIWGLLHVPVFKALHDNTGKGTNSFWQQLPVMAKWTDDSWNPETSSRTVPQHIHLADYIASASDRGLIGSVTNAINYAPENDRDRGLEISHLLSGEKLDWKTRKHQELINTGRKDYLEGKEQDLFNAIPQELLQPDNEQALFWWLWRCLPTAATRLLDDESLILMPAENRLPDSSIWSHGSITAALAGALAGYNLTVEQIDGSSETSQYTLSHPYLVTFTFSPIQELIKASRKMRDFWAGSWILHYISAKISWKLACKYGPDALLYPSLYQQPLIDRWLLDKYGSFNFSDCIKEPSDSSLLTAGFPNILVLVLPKDEVNKAMQTANQVLKETWQELSSKVFENLPQRWRRELSASANSWDGWLNSQWQTYWTAMPIGVVGQELTNANIPLEKADHLSPWLELLNDTYGIKQDSSIELFQQAELNFLRQAYQQRLDREEEEFSVNVGSWWGYIFDAMRINLTSVKNARNWVIPTAFTTRSTISGVGAVAYPTHGNDWATEAEVKDFWQERAGLFDGHEKLNATEVVKRGLHKILPDLLGLEQSKLAAAYPDLSGGVAGYLKTSGNAERDYYLQSCQQIKNAIELDSDRSDDYKWGIPWAESDRTLKDFHPRLLNAGWLVEDLKQISTDTDRISKRTNLQTIIDGYYPQNNPTDWYVLAAGDGDGMSEWLKGLKLGKYREYIPSTLPSNSPEMDGFLEIPKRMGPSTHNALSRALLDFSNQLLPYLTEERYAGRLIYGGGDDVLAYTNLWEWDRWLWDIRQCFRGEKDPLDEFKEEGNYWQWNSTKPKPKNIADRPLFTMGNKATISFGIVIAHQSVPLAIALENLWAAEKSAKEHQSIDLTIKDALQVRVMYGNGNILPATAKFEVFKFWQELLDLSQKLELESAIFESVATVWEQHPAPNKDAIAPWCRAFCSRRDIFAEDEDRRIEQIEFSNKLAEFITKLSDSIQITKLDREVNNWLKLAAFVLRKRQIKLIDN